MPLVALGAGTVAPVASWEPAAARAISEMANATTDEPVSLGLHVIDDPPVARFGPSR